MRFVLDLHAAQAAPGSEDGTYVLQLVQALAADARQHEVLLVLNGARVAEAAALRARFRDLLPASAICSWFSPAPAARDAASLAWARDSAAAIYRTLVDRLAPDVLFFSDPEAAHGHPAATGDRWLAAGVLGIVRVGQRLQVRSALPSQASEATLAAPAEPSAARVWDYVESLKGPAGPGACAPSASRLRLAYVSPVPPARTGIADYSADLLASLQAWYDIDVVTSQTEVDADALPAGCTVRTSDWFMANGGAFDRVVYHFGNSHFHSHMPELAARWPGVVFLHDFFLGDLLYLFRKVDAEAWNRAYYKAHGYLAARDARLDELRAVLARYPVNFQFVQRSRGVVVHSEHACELARKWLPPEIAGRFRTVPLIRPAVDEPARDEARRALGIAPDTLLVCCFGHLGAAKGNLEIVQAWTQALLKAPAGCELVFVGAHAGGEYGAMLDTAVAAANAGDPARPIRIAGWIDAQDYVRYLEAADVAVQLRTLSRGESSAAALDCMNHGLPTIVNRHGALAELPSDSVHFIDGAFSVAQLARALGAVCGDAALRERLANRAREVVRTLHAPEACGQACAEAIEAAYRHGEGSWQAAAAAVAALPGLATRSHDELAHCSNALARTLPPPASARRLLLDISAVCRTDLRTGIQRVARALLLAFMESPPPGFRIEPVYISDIQGTWDLHHAQRYTARLLGAGAMSWPADEVVEGRPGDIFLGLDFSAGYIREAAQVGLFERMRQNGVEHHFIVYDLLPLLRPDVFPEGTADTHEQWLRIVMEVSSSVVCISGAVAAELATWTRARMPKSTARIRSFHLGADVASSAPTQGMPADAPALLQRLAERPTLLAVGTIEPRKGVTQALEAFDLLRSAGREVNLVLVGKAGWHVEDLVARLRGHREKGVRLFWLEGISDEYLEAVYAAADCLLAPSEGEGFGLPLIEAAQKGIPILARDIPVFREVAGEHASYFSGTQARDLASAVEAWLALHAEGRHPRSENMPWLTWRQSAKQLQQALDL